MTELCIFCGKTTILGSLQKCKGGFFRQTYICRYCGHQYVNGPAFNEIPIDRRYLDIEHPSCPRCGSPETVFNEWLESEKQLKPEFKCKACNRCFTIGGKLNPNSKNDPITKTCPHCSGNVWRYGKTNTGVQKYICKECGKQFTE